MTLVNKFVVSGANFSMNFLLLCMQSAVCCACVFTVKRAGIITFRDFDLKDAKAWFPVSFMLVLVIYTGSKSLVRCCHLDCVVMGSNLRSMQQFLSIPVYTIFKNLTIILIVRMSTFKQHVRY